MSQTHGFVLRTVALTALVFRLGPATADDMPEPRFEITPKVWFVGDPKLDIRLVNLAPNQKVTVVAHTGRNVARVSRLVGIADAKGQFDLRGSYEPSPKTGAPFRILWDSKEDPSVEPMKQVGLYHFRAEVDEKRVASGSFQIDNGLRQEPKVTRVEVTQRGLHGEFFVPPGNGPFPGAIVLGGSEGGLGLHTRLKAAALARHGFACLALAYFNYPNLPERLVEVPLEYFGSAIAWMKEHKHVRGDRLAVIGASRGGELALLLGATYPDVKAVVAYTPSQVVWSGWPQAEEDVKNKSIRPAWTYKGKPVPFMGNRSRRGEKLGSRPTGEVGFDG
jgi:hypothetical protein